MNKYDNIRKILKDFYFGPLTEKASNIKEEVYKKMDEYAEKNPDATSYHLKSKLYEAIVDSIDPVIFPDIPYFFETSALVAFSDGKYNRGITHANGWLYERNNHLFIDVDPKAYEIYRGQWSQLYVQCGTYTDMLHLGLPMKKLFKVGLKGILEELDIAEKTCTTDEEKDFISCAKAGINALWKIEKKFAEKATKEGYFELAEIAKRVPYNPPQTMHEGLCTMAFLRKALGALEGMGFSSFGRVDVLLEPLYENDINKGTNEEELLDLVTKFLLIWDCTLDLSKKMERGFEYEMENSLTLGGCDEEGKAVFNGVTKLFLKARENETILYPKMMLRYSENSPDEYLKLISEPLVKSKSFSLYENDDSIIPALIKSGIDLKDARDYAVGGCWDILLQNVAIHNSGEYVNILRPLQWSIHKDFESMTRSGFDFESLEEIGTFEEIYRRYLGFVRRVLMSKASIISYGAKQWHKVNPVGAISALMEPCIPNKLDVTAGGGKYNRETAYFCGFAESVDSLLAIKDLCFDKKVCTVKELFDECRCNWQNEILRQRAIHSPSYGDGSEESSQFVAKFIDDLYEITRDLPTSQPGEYRLGSNLYTEVVRWGKTTPAMPNGRHDGDYLAQGLSPTRYQRPYTLTDLLYSYRYTDMSKLAANASVTVTLPAAKFNKEKMVQFFRAAAKSGLQALQPNCVNMEDLISAQKEPENYKHIIVRVCGFSAPFVALSKEYQDEVILRMVSEG